MLKVFTRTVTYDANGGSGAPDAQVKAWGEALTLSAARPTKAEYTFQGWAKSAGAAAAEFQPGGSYAAHENAWMWFA